MLYFLTFTCAAIAAFIFTPALRLTAGPYLGDAPTGLKKHKGTIPCVGGSAIALAFFGSLIMVRFLTDFPTGTLNHLRGIFWGGLIIFAVGLIDDLRKPSGIGPYTKLLFQATAALLLIKYGIFIQFLPAPFNYILTILWVAGVTNAFNLIDIGDGLAASQAFLASLAFLIIALPSERIYVNFAAAALLGAVSGFWPYNHLHKLKCFLGDSGSTLLGFITAALALGADYSAINPMAVFAPLLILAVPLFDTTFVSVIRMSKGISPLRGTPDHFPIRLGLLGLKKHTILLLSILVTLVLDVLAFFVTKTTTTTALIIYCAVLTVLLCFAAFLKIKTK